MMMMMRGRRRKEGRAIRGVASVGPEVMLNGSRVVGLHLPLGPLGSVSAFLGIPYATPPVGQLRFQKTVPLNYLPTVVNATTYKPECFSTIPNERQSEDCLYLNVWLPAEATPPLSVMVWIHGGGFVMGNSSSPPGMALAAEQQVIVVSMNYRLAALGFLSTGDAESPGNYGLWDQHVALRWVKDNIAAFGGDPGSITVFGESAGGKSVSFQVISPHSGHLFQRAIIQSGTALSPTALQWKPLETAVRLARAVHCPTDSHKDLVQCLRQRPAIQISGASGRLWGDAIRQLIDFGWSPVEDGDFVPYLYHSDGSPRPLSPAFTGSLMLGNNNNEGGLLKLWRFKVASFIDPNIESELRDAEFFTYRYLPEVLAQMFKSLPDDSPSFQTTSEAVTCVYKDSNSSTISAEELYHQFGDQAYVAPTFLFLEQWLNASRSPVFVYIFDNYPGIPRGEGLEGMWHADDLYYTFHGVGPWLKRYGMPAHVVTREAKVALNFRKLLTNFAKSGNPVRPVALDPGWPNTWPMYDVHRQVYLSVSSTPAVADHYRSDYMALWNQLVPRLVSAGNNGNGTSTSYTCDRVKQMIG
ncbi:carboxylesterase 1E-like [Babylonia areolata]|uniref:carboxylesterase 1E-like n=1 Tax=Babylonia areolata TaxID=304850 RepID=UPI003FD03D65